MNNTEVIRLDVIVGSKAHGLDRPDSDEDRKGFYIARTIDFWKFDSKPKEQLEDKENDRTYYEIGKFLKLCLSCNPTILEVLYSNKIVYATTNEGYRVRGNRRIFLSKKAIKTYGGYATQQIKKFLSAEIGSSRQSGWKNAVHTARLYVSGTHLLRTGNVLVNIKGHESHQHLVAIRNGEMSRDDFIQYVNLLEKDFKKAADNTNLPKEPNYSVANKMLYDFRLRNLWHR